MRCGALSAEPASAPDPSPPERTALAAVEVGLVSMPRFRSTLDRFGARLLARVFSEAEVAYARRKRDGTHNLAVRFAAKCAGRRALRRIGVRAGWQDLEVVRRRSGEPTLALRGRPAELLEADTSGAPAASPFPHMRISLTHDPAFAAAVLFVECGELA